MDKDKKKIIAGAGVLGGVGLLYLLTRKAKGIPPEPPPGEDYGRARGYVLDAETNAKIMNAEIYVDGVFQCYSDSEGTYYTDYFLFGPHTITVKANNYETTDFPINLNETLMRVDLSLPPLPEAPTEWTEGVEVTKITAEPPTLYLGETVHIGVSIKYPYPLPLPANIHGSILIDGTKLSTDVTIDFRNPTLPFQYTPAKTGEYLIRAQDKSASFTVLQDIPAHYYSPFGGKRMPLCTDILIPNIAPFTVPWGFTHPGGDLVYSDVMGGSISRFPEPPMLPRESRGQIQYATPIKWTPSEAVINNWVSYYYERLNTRALTVMAVDYTCPEYWNSKNELAKMIAGSVLSVLIPDEWILQYGTTCPTCNGTGLSAARPYRRCPTCYGRGKILKVDLLRGIRDWVKPVGVDYSCFQGHCDSWIECPYCSTKITHSNTDVPRLDLAKRLLNHIETKHPDHPLTKPAWF